MSQVKPEDVHIHQIYFSEEQKAGLDPAFIPYDNRGGKHPELREFYILYENYKKGLHKQAKLTGMVSWKFQDKTAMTGQKFIDFIVGNPGYDVYFVNPFPQALVFKNVWLQGEFCHKGMLELSHQILKASGVTEDLKALEMDLENTLYCNYWVGTEAFWDKYMAFVLPAYEYVFTTLLEQERNKLFVKAGRDDAASFFPYIFERFFSTLLLKDESISGKAYRYSRQELNKKYGKIQAPVVELITSPHGNARVARFGMCLCANLLLTLVRIKRVFCLIPRAIKDFKQRREH